MGYTIATPCRSAGAQTKMLEFWEQNYRSWPTLHGRSEGPCYISSPRSDLDYDRGRWRVGFNYNAALGERHYAFNLCQFMALRVGRLKRFKDFEDSAPYIVYDGYESWPVLDKAEWVDVPKQWSWTLVDHTGYRLSEETLNGRRRARVNPTWDRYLEESKRSDAVIRKELARLAKLWDEF